jgi:hypothetical protein
MSQRKLAMAFPWSWLETEATALSTTTTPNYYTLPPDFYNALTVRYKDSQDNVRVLFGGPVEHEDSTYPKQTDTAAGRGPQRAIITGRTLLLRPGAAVAGESIILRYLRTPPDLVDDLDVPIIPDVFRDALITGALFIGHRWLFEDKGEQDRLRDEMLDWLGKMIQAEKGGTFYNENMGLDTGWYDMAQQAWTNWGNSGVIGGNQSLGYP